VQSWRKNRARQIGKYRQQYDYRCPNSTCRHAIVDPYVLPAAAIIDWDHLGHRIGDRTRPLAASTVRRIEAGLVMFGYDPTMVSVNHDTLRPPCGHPPPPSRAPPRDPARPSQLDAVA
jgi:DNA (cytosine-5)-methyltransferase 1